MRLLLAVALCGVLAACGDDGAPSTGSEPTPAGGFSGRFTAPGSAVLVLAERGDIVDLTMHGETVQGRKTSAGRFEGDARVAGGGLQFVVTRDGDNVRARFTLLRDGGETQELPETLYTRLPPDPPGVARDIRLIGHWRHTETHVSGEFSYVSDSHLVLEGDGTLSTWDKTRSSAGGGDSQPSGGTWRTDGDELFVRLDGAAEWSSAGRFSLTDTHLMLTRGGSKTVYERL